jgi:hypothetical protein
MKMTTVITRWIIGLAGLLALVALGATGCTASKTSEEPAALLEKGWYDYGQGDFDLAIERFEAVVATAPKDSSEHFDALYGLATTWNLRRPKQDTELASEFYEQIIAEAPDSDLAAWSRLALARIKHLVPVGQDPDYDAVRSAYEDVITQHPDHLAAGEAFLYLQATYLQEMTPASARKVAKDVQQYIADNPDSPFLSPCYSILATCYEVLNQPEKRLQCELKAYEYAEVDPTNPFQDNSWRYWMLATLAEFGAGDFDTARTYYKKLLEEYPLDIRKYAVMQALERMDKLEEEIRNEIKKGS